MKEKESVGSLEGSSSLQAAGLVVSFDGLRVLDGVDLVLGRDEILGLIGPNGAGKTTVINALSGVIRPTRGSVLLEGREVTGRRVDQRSRWGLARTFQGVRLFGRLTVRENVEAGALGRGVRRREARDRADALVRRFGLGHCADVEARQLPYGDERRIAVARALAGAPRVLLLDEPAAGLNEAETQELAQTLREVRQEFGCSLLLVEHDMHFVMGLCDRVQVLAQGGNLAIGTPAEIMADPAVAAAYLGQNEVTNHAAG